MTSRKGGDGMGESEGEEGMTWVCSINVNNEHDDSDSKSL